MSALNIEEVIAEIENQPVQTQSQQQPAKPLPKRKISDVQRDLRIIQRRVARLLASY
jgi:hypothetical protein